MEAIGYETEEGEFIKVPTVWVICGECKGEGKSSAYLGDVTNWLASEAAPEEADDYFAGGYDKPCDCCRGSGKIKVADFERMTPEMSAAYQLDRQIERDLRAEEAAERRFGC